jgi:hypothetical protein
MKNDINIEQIKTYFGLTKAFTVHDLKSARRRLTAKYHPDRAPQNCVEEYTRKTQDINNYYDRLLPFCVSSFEKIEDKIKNTKSMKHIFYGMLLLLLLPILFFGGILNLVFASYPWYTFVDHTSFLEFTCGIAIYLFTFFIYFFKFKLPPWLFLTQVLSILMVFNLL